MKKLWKRRQSSERELEESSEILSVLDLINFIAFLLFMYNFCVVILLIFSQNKVEDVANRSYVNNFEAVQLCIAAQLVYLNPYD